jgi:hypothetical protein
VLPEDDGDRDPPGQGRQARRERHLKRRPDQIERRREEEENEVLFFFFSFFT